MITPCISQLATLMQLPKLNRVQAINQILSSTICEQEYEDLDALWNNWCEVLYFQLEALRLSSANLVLAARVRRREIEYHMDRCCMTLGKRREP